MSYGFCSKFHTLSSNAKSVNIGLVFDKVTESIKVGTFLETQCMLNYHQLWKRYDCLLVITHFIHGLYESW